MTTRRVGRSRSRLTKEPADWRETRRYMTEFFLSFDPPLRRSFGTITIDTSELVTRMKSVRRAVSELVSVPIAEASRTRLIHAVVDLSVQLQDLESISRDLQAPLQRMSSALHEKGRFKPGPAALRRAAAALKGAKRGR